MQVENNRIIQKTIAVIFSVFMAVALAALTPSIAMAQESADTVLKEENPEVESEGQAPKQEGQEPEAGQEVQAPSQESQELEEGQEGIGPEESQKSQEPETERESQESEEGQEGQKGQEDTGQEGQEPEAKAQEGTGQEGQEPEAKAQEGTGQEESQKLEKTQEGTGQEESQEGQEPEAEQESKEGQEGQAPQEVLQIQAVAVTALAEAGIRASGTDWTLDDNGGLMITSDAGMSDAIRAMNADASLKAQVKTVELKGITSIPSHAFREYSELISVTISENVTQIGTQAFQSCSKLISVSIPEGVTHIGDHAFSSCGSLTDMTIPESVRVIGQYAFSNCYSLPEIRIPAGVSDSDFGKPCIAEGAFEGCSSLTKVEIPEGIVELKTLAFSDCKNLTSVSVPDSVTKIGLYAFSSCPKLASVTIPQNVDSIETMAFWHDFALTSVIMKSQTPPKLGSSVFESCPLSSGGIYVPAGTGTDYRNASTWTDWKAYIVDGGDLMAEARPIVEAALAGIIVTNETAQETIQAVVNEALADAAISTVSASVSNFDKVPAAVGKEGRVTCTVTISCGSASESILFERTIAAGEEEENKPEEGPAKVEGEVVTDGTTLSIQLAVSAEELADMLLSDAEKQLLAEGKSVRIVLDIKSVPADVGQEDRALVEAALDGGSIGEYLDISLMKIVEGVEIGVSDTGEKLLITISLPDSLKNNDSGRQRNFYVIRVHNGEVEILEDLDDSEDSITIATDRFSTYAIVYKDVIVDGNGADGSSGMGGNNSNGGSGSTGGNNSNGGSSNTGGGSNTGKNIAVSSQSERAVHGQGSGSPKTGDCAPLPLYAILILTASLAGLVYLHLYDRGLIK